MRDESDPPDMAGTAQTAGRQGTPQTPSKPNSYARTDSPTMAAVRGKCPRCGEGALYSGFLTIAEGCNVCGLSFEKFDPGDGPAFFVMSFVGFAVAGGAMAVELIWQPAYWIHVVLWVPMTLGLSVGLLRPAKGWLVGDQFKHKAEEGQLDL